MKSKTVLCIGLALVLIGIVLVYTGQRSHQSSSLPPLSGIYAEHTTYYDIDASYATSTPLAGDKNRQAVLQMKQFVDDTVAQFKKDGDLANLSTDEKQRIEDTGAHLSLDVNYMTASSPHTISYMFTINSYSGGAHDNTYFKTFTYDLSSGTSLTLSDLFVPGATYLDTLSSISRAKLPALIGPSMTSANMLAEGTKPEEESFADFFLDGNSLVILFPPYAVAPFAAGAQTLAIPITDLKSILKAEYQ